MDKPLITSEGALADERLAKIDHVLNVLLRPLFAKLNIKAEEWQAGVIENGGHLQDLVAGVVKNLVKMASGIVTPRRAEETGLLRVGWKVYVTEEGVRKDKLEGDVNLANVDYVCPLNDSDGDLIGGEVLLQRAVELNAIGSLGYAAELFKAQDEGKEIFPVESRGRHYFAMPLTEILDEHDKRCVAYFRWEAKSRRWGLFFPWLSGNFSRMIRLVCQKNPSVA